MRTDQSSFCAWRRPPENLAIGDTEVHLWFALLDSAEPYLGRLDMLLDAQERSRSRRFHFQQHRRWFIARRAILRSLLGRYASVDPAQICYALGPAGKPELASQIRDEAITFSISHSQGAALFGFARGRRIGVDLEVVRPMRDMEQIVARAFSTREKDAFFALPVDLRRDAFFRCWTAKEAFLKALGDGLSRELDHFDILPGPGSRMCLQSVRWDPEAPERWLLENTPTLGGFEAAVAVEKSSQRKTQLTFENYQYIFENQDIQS